MTEQTTPAGWYPDPQMASTQRYWDGERWTEQVAPLPQAPQGDATNAAARVFLILCAVGVVVLMVVVAASFA